MSSQRIIHVEAIGNQCEILVDNAARARQRVAEIKMEGVWESVNGIRWRRISPDNIVRIKVINPSVNEPPPASSKRKKEARKS